MDDRVDPVTIFAGVGERDGRARAFEVWCYKADRAGWPVEVESTSFDGDGDECGVVRIEGLRYRIRHSPRLRQLLGHVDSRQHPIAALVKMTRGGQPEGGVTWAVHLTHAAWAEPIVEA